MTTTPTPDTTTTPTPDTTTPDMTTTPTTAAATAAATAATTTPTTAATTAPRLSALRTSLPRSTTIAAAAFLIAGALRLTAATELLGLSAAFAVSFYLVAAAQLGFGLLLATGTRPRPRLPVALTAMVLTLGFVGLWLVATTATVPIYPLMNSPYPIDVLDLGTAVLEVTSVVALCKSFPHPTRRRIGWTLVGLCAAAWLVWLAIIVTHGLTD